MRIAVASGKGGTGKTTVAVNLAVSAARVGLHTAYVDCDVEEPNGHLFLKPVITDEVSIYRPIPVVDGERCTLCARCSPPRAWNLGDSQIATGTTENSSIRIRTATG